MVKEQEVETLMMKMANVRKGRALSETTPLEAQVKYLQMALDVTLQGMVQLLESQKAMETSLEIQEARSRYLQGVVQSLVNPFVS